MDIYEYLKKDHQNVAKLFDLYKTANSENNKIEIIAILIKELTLHTEAEEHTFYKLLNEFPQNVGKVMHSEEEHADIKMLLHELSQTKKISEPVDVLVMQLKNIVDHHVHEEETDMFRLAKDVFSEEEAIIIKEKMHFYKTKLLEKRSKIKKPISAKKHKKELV